MNVNMNLSDASSQWLISIQQNGLNILFVELFSDIPPARHFQQVISLRDLNKRSAHIKRSMLEGGIAVTLLEISVFLFMKKPLFGLLFDKAVVALLSILYCRN